MTQINISLSKLIQDIILTTPGIMQSYNTKFHNSKYPLNLIINEILYVLKSGVSWRDSRSQIHWNTLFWHFNRLSSFGIFQKLFNRLRVSYSEKHNLDVQIVDSTFIMNKFGKDCIARNKFFKNKNCNKVSFVTDINGIPLSVLFNTGNVHDLSFVNDHIDDLIVLTKKYPAKHFSLLADKGYVSRKLKGALSLKHYNFIYPCKKNMAPDPTFDKVLYKKRIFVEHSFQKLKSFKRIQLRYDSLLSNFSSFIFLAVSHIIFNKLNN